MARLPDRELPVVDKTTAKMVLEWFAALRQVVNELPAVRVFSGEGAPTLSAPKGSLYSRLDGSDDGINSNRLYINTDGATGWVVVRTGTT